MDTLWPEGLGMVASSPLPPGYFGHTPVEVPAYDPERARELLAEAGYPDGLTVEDYFVTMSYEYPKIMTMIQEQLKHVGVDVQLQLVEHPTYHRNIRNNPESPSCCNGGTRLTDGRRDAQPVLSLRRSPRSRPTGNKGTNFAPLQPASTTCWKRGAAPRDSDARAAIYHEAQKRIMDDAVCMPIADIPSRSAPQPDARQHALRSATRRVCSALLLQLPRNARGGRIRRANAALERRPCCPYVIRRLLIAIPMLLGRHEHRLLRDAHPAGGTPASP